MFIGVDGGVVFSVRLSDWSYVTDIQLGVRIDHTFTYAMRLCAQSVIVTYHRHKHDSFDLTDSP